MIPFQTVPLSEHDTLSGSILTHLQQAVLQNRRAEIATDKLNLPFTPNDPLTFAQQEAFLRGQLELIQYLLDLSEESQKIITTQE